MADLRQDYDLLEKEVSRLNTIMSNPNFEREAPETKRAAAIRKEKAEKALSVVRNRISVPEMYSSSAEMARSAEHALDPLEEKVEPIDDNGQLRTAVVSDKEPFTPQAVKTKENVIKGKFPMSSLDPKELWLEPPRRSGETDEEYADRAEQAWTDAATKAKAEGRQLIRDEKEFTGSFDKARQWFEKAKEGGVSAAFDTATFGTGSTFGGQAYDEITGQPSGTTRQQLKDAQAGSPVGSIIGGGIGAIYGGPGNLAAGAAKALGGGTLARAAGEAVAGAGMGAGEEFADRAAAEFAGQQPKEFSAEKPLLYGVLGGAFGLGGAMLGRGGQKVVDASRKGTDYANALNTLEAANNGKPVTSVLRGMVIPKSITEEEARVLKLIRERGMNLNSEAPEVQKTAESIFKQLDEMKSGMHKRHADEQSAFFRSEDTSVPMEQPGPAPMPDTLPRQEGIKIDFPPVREGEPVTIAEPSRRYPPPLSGPETVPVSAPVTATTDTQVTPWLDPQSSTPRTLQSPPMTEGSPSVGLDDAAPQTMRSPGQSGIPSTIEESGPPTMRSLRAAEPVPGSQQPTARGGAPDQLPNTERSADVTTGETQRIPGVNPPPASAPSPGGAKAIPLTPGPTGADVFDTGAQDLKDFILKNADDIEAGDPAAARALRAYAEGKNALADAVNAQEMDAFINRVKDDIGSQPGGDALKRAQRRILFQAKQLRSNWDEFAEMMQAQHEDMSKLEKILQTFGLPGNGELEAGRHVSTIEGKVIASGAGRDKAAQDLIVGDTFTPDVKEGTKKAAGLVAARRMRGDDVMHGKVGLTDAGSLNLKGYGGLDRMIRPRLDALARYVAKLQELPPGVAAAAAQEAEPIIAKMLRDMGILSPEKTKAKTPHGPFGPPVAEKRETP